MYDHDYIESNQIIDRYILGRLDESEREVFESHFLNCRQCLDELELTEALGRDLKKTVAREAASHILGNALLGRLLGVRVIRGLGLAVGMVLLIGIPALIFRQSSEQVQPLQFRLDTGERGGVQVEELLNLSASPSEVAFVQEVFADEYSRFRVSLINPDSDETEWQDQVLLRRRRLSFSLPSAVLKGDHYRLVIDIQEDDGGFIIFDSHDLRIVRK